MFGLKQASKQQPVSLRRKKCTILPGLPFTAETTDQSALENAKGTVIVSAETANIRSKPSFDADKVAWVSKGTFFKVLDESQDVSGRIWCKVRLADGRECWISKRVVAERQ